METEPVRTEARERGNVQKQLRRTFDDALFHPSHTTVDMLIELFNKLQDTYSDHQLAEFMVRNTIYRLANLRIYSSNSTLASMEIDPEAFKQAIDENELYPECEAGLQQTLTPDTTVAQLITWVTEAMEPDTVK